MIKYLIIDIDGTLTDGGVYYDETGNELKKFSTKDGTGIIMARKAGIIPVVLTGRESTATIRRMTELGVTEVHQGIKDKVTWLKNWMNTNYIKKNEIGYIGDDLNDLCPMELCGFISCPKDAIDEVKEKADYISSVAGGYGVVRDVIRHILSQENLWASVVNRTYGIGV